MINDNKNIENLNMKNSRNFILKKEFLNENSSFSNKLNSENLKIEIENSIENSKILLNYYYFNQPKINIIKNYYFQNNFQINEPKEINFQYFINNNNNSNFYIQNNNEFNNNNIILFNFSEKKILQLSPILLHEQNGSRFLQNKIRSDIKFCNEKFFPNLLKIYNENEINKIICDQFGNYLFQAMIENLTHKNLLKFLNIISKNFYEISINIFGTRVIQKLINIINNNEKLLNEFDNIFFKEIDKLIFTSHGNHIFQKYIEEVKFNEKNIIFDYLINNFNKISINKFGCCTIQKCLTNNDKNFKTKFLNLIYENINFLLSNQFGTFIFQFMIENETKEIKINLINKILPNFMKICKTKYSSNTIEKCLENDCKEIHIIILNKICESKENVYDLILNPFGNYIIQKALKVCEKNQYEFILKILAENIKEIKKVKFGLKLISKLICDHPKINDFIIDCDKKNLFN